MANIKSKLLKWFLDPPSSGGKPKPPPRGGKPKPPKPNVRQRKDGRWAVVGNPNKTYANKGAATRAFNQQQKAAAEAKRKKNQGNLIALTAVGGLGAAAATRPDKKDDKGPTIKRAKVLKADVKKTAPKKRTAAELELIPEGARPPAAKKTAAKPATTKRTAAELELIPKGARPPAARKTAPKKLKSFEQGVRHVDTPFGKIKMDTTDEGMWPDHVEYDKAGGQVKGTVKRRMGGVIKKGYGKAQRGY